MPAISISSELKPTAAPRHWWIVPVCLLFLAQVMVIIRVGTSYPGHALNGAIDLGLNLLCINLLIQASRRSNYLARYFWRLAVFSVSLFCLALLLNIYVNIIRPSQLITEIGDMLSVFWFGPVSLTLFLDPDFEPSRFDRIHILDFIQVVLFWIAVYFFFLYLPAHEPPQTILDHHPWLRSTWVGTLVYDGALAIVFLLRSILTDSPVVRALFGRVGILLVFAGVADFCDNFYGPQEGSWYQIVWTLLNIALIVIVATWNKTEVPKPAVRETPSTGMIGNRLFPILYAFLVLILSMFVVRGHIAFALSMVSLSFVCSSLRLIIIQQREQRVEISLQAEIAERKRAEEQLRDHKERLEQQVEERTAELVGSEQRLRQAQKMEAIGRLAGGIAHDFNNLLNVILGSTEMQMFELPSSSPSRIHSENIRKASNQAASLTRQLLAFSRKEVAEVKVLDLNSVLRETGELLPRLLGEDVEIVMHTPAEPALVHADPVRIQQIILNLAVNARDAMPNGGTLILETAHEEMDEHFASQHSPCTAGSYVRLSVSDTGTGISPELQSHIFEPFFTTKEQGKGTGLGLFTVYGIVQQAGGAISMYSENGLGTTFKIYLARVQGQVEVAPTAEVPLESLRGTETILLVEDQETLREMVSRFLQKQGYTVLAAGRPSEALELATQHNQEIDLLLTDVVMPGMHGPELAGHIRELHPRIRTLFVSGYTPDRISLVGISESEISFLAKPVRMKVLAQKLREMLQSPVRPPAF